MSGARPSSPRVLRRTSRSALLGLTAVLGVSAVVAVLLLSVFSGTAGAISGRGDLAGAAPRSLSLPVAPANFKLVNLSANNTTVDVSMAFNVSVNVVNLTGGALNASNYTFAWTGLPAFVPGTPGSGCAGTNPGNNSSVLNCTAASAGSLTISVTATNFTGQSNGSTTLPILVNPLPTLTSLTVSEFNSTLGTQIWFNATASGGTAPLTFSYTGLPLGCAGTSASFACTPTRAGIYSVAVMAIDSYGYNSTARSAAVTVSAAKTSSPGIGTTGWAVVIGIVVVGAIVTVALLFQARREERAGRMGMEEPAQQPPQESGGTPPMGGSPPPGPPT
ncbi:MAG: hypothetical protein WCB19_03130 [Thermoplasmata archaeon]